MLEVVFTNSFDKSMKLAKKRGKNLSKAEKIVEMLRLQQQLPEKQKDHPLIGNYKGTRECKIEPDWLLVYYISDGVLYLVDTGSHSDLFG
jgi:mRNA interferase YafQ